MKSKYRFTISEIEVRDITLALVALAFAFSLALFSDEIFLSGSNLLTVIKAYPLYFGQAIIAVGIGFILHEMSHKFVAQRYGLWAEFRAWPAGLMMAIGLALFSRGGFIFAAPGAVMISPVKKVKHGYEMRILKPEESGKISIAGSVTNVILAIAFAAVAALTGLGIFHITAQVNAWLALFNMIPVAMLDGAKVFHWSKSIWLGFTILCGALFILTVMV